jgi:hypothetical protein
MTAEHGAKNLNAAWWLDPLAWDSPYVGDEDDVEPARVWFSIVDGQVVYVCKELKC